jgi:DNA-binding NtrC family response regulator
MSRRQALSYQAIELRILEGFLDCPGGAKPFRHLERDRDIMVLMTDIGLPGMDGQQLAAEARRRRPGIGILFVTGYDDLIKKGQSLGEDGFEYLAKPYGCEDLTRALKRLVGFGGRCAEEPRVILWPSQPYESRESPPSAEGASGDFYSQQRF